MLGEEGIVMRLMSGISCDKTKASI